MFLSRCLFLVALLVAHAQADCGSDQKGLQQGYPEKFGDYYSKQQTFSVSLPIDAAACQSVSNQAGYYVNVCADNEGAPVVRFRQNGPALDVDVQRSQYYYGEAKVSSGLYCSVPVKTDAQPEALASVDGPKKSSKN